MKKSQLSGIEGWLEKNEKLNLKDLAEIHYRLMREYPIPSINIENHEEWNPGSSVTIQMKGMPAPAIDVFKGEFIEHDGNDPNLPVYASFRTTTGTTIRTLKRTREDQYSVILPEKLINGLMGVVFPVQENFGPKEILNTFTMDIQNWIKGSKHIPRANLTREDCPSLSAPLLNFRYLAAIVPHPLRFNFSAACTICPYGALIGTGEYCYVDPLICRGQKYSRLNSQDLDGSMRGPEEICWNCFNVGDGAVSTKCDYVTIRKVLHLNPDEPRQEVPCCGGCEIPNLCPNGAIYSSPTYRFFAADKQRCNGCMLCYLNKDCPWNCGSMCTSDCEHYDRDSSVRMPDGEGGWYSRNVHNNYTMRMVAHIDGRLKLVLVRLKVLRIEDYLPRPYDAFFDPRNYDSDSDESDFFNFDLIIWGDKQEKIPINLEENGSQEFKLKEIPFTQSVHLGLFEKDGRLLGFSYCGSNLPIRSLGGKRYSDPTKLVDGGTFSLHSPMGIIQIEYSIE